MIFWQFVHSRFLDSIDIVSDTAYDDMDQGNLTSVVKFSPENEKILGRELINLKVENQKHFIGHPEWPDVAVL